MKKTLIGLAAAAALLAHSAAANAFEIGVVAFQMSSETHARVANAVEAAAKEKGWDVTVLNSNGTLPTHAEQIENLVQRGVDGIILAMSKPVEFDAQMAAVKEAGIPLITVMSGASPHALMDVQVNEYAVGASAALYLLGQIGYQGPILTQRFESNVGTRVRGKMLDVVLSENTGVEVVGTHSMARTKSWREDVRSGMSALILQNAGNFKGIWASFDGQAFIIDDLLKEQGMNKGDVVLVSIDGGAETYRRIKDPDSMLMATVAIPFEKMGAAAVDAMQKIAIDGADKASITSGPYLFMDAELVDAANVDKYLD
ncbi:simple sugar transport system substrate-binding protein/ribose transport system substrate-binding protein [Rhodobium orientis]|uniref:LacI family transcriptional regulator n=1 Tax=Rhodobium orientis TaxID=34017 RepID=A0A327JX44_9HYPH|nr:sugar ABC transporter substrate-binding protein [Rhodobium orientis]MBB4301075.1 simple sugar transport system substrate-binding protein/ribose transport system substrate-binding protein [Rhodobium orientis]MBK5949743.1 LacI family transcriptional regulator [Rhodobium orientis]RAI30144.1 LacI family transcriptional regulator [Rhodobium orientis]